MYAKKSLGQNFLTSKAIIADVVRAAEINETDTVLEIGPGKGVLTEALLASVKKVIAIEKDRELIPFLQEKFKADVSSGKLILIHDDFLKTSVASLVEKNFKVVANIPYNITGQLLRVLLQGSVQPERVVLMVQKEVADRVVARDGKESVLSISVKVFGEPKYIQTVPKRYFKPQPKVDSAILCIKNIGRDFFENSDEEKFFELLKAGFAHKRKFLIRNIESLYTDKNIEEIFKKINLSPKVRAEDVSLDMWKNLAKNI